MRESGRERKRERGRERTRERGREGEREGEREGGRERGREGKGLGERGRAGERESAHTWVVGRARNSDKQIDIARFCVCCDLSKRCADFVKVSLSVVV